MKPSTPSEQPDAPDADSSQAAHTADSASDSSDTEQIEHTLDEHRKALQKLFPVPPPRKKRKAARKLGGGSAAAALLTASLWWLNPSYDSQQWATAIGEVQTIALRDGSTLTLDTSSRVQVQWRLRSREVALQQGRAHFDVAANHWRPFTVTAENIAVRVVGTRFDVWRQPEYTTVTVQQGTVTVSARPGKDEHESPQDHTRSLTAGQQLTVPRTLNATGWQTLQPQAVDATGSAAWQHGQLVFNNTPLIDALHQIQRYRAKPIRIVGPLRGPMPVSGVFHTRNTDELLDQLGEILPIRVQRHADGHVDIHLR